MSCKRGGHANRAKYSVCSGWARLRLHCRIVIVTHSMQQAARVSRRVAYFHLGSSIEVDETDKIFTNPRHKLTEDYITGRIGCN